MKIDKGKGILLIILLILIIWMSKKMKDEISKNGSLENLGIPFSWPGEWHPPVLTPARLFDNLRNLLTLQWWRGLWTSAAYAVHSDPAANQMIINSWINAGATADQVLQDKVNPEVFTALEGYQWLQDMYEPAFMDYRFCIAADFAATQLEIYVSAVQRGG